MKNVFVYCEVTEEKTIADVSLELLSKGRKLAEILGVQLEAMVFTDEIGSILERIQDFGVDNKTIADGLAVGRASGFVGKTLEDLVSGCYTLQDETMLKLLTLMKDYENISLEPSALAGFGGILFSTNPEYQDYVDRYNINRDNITHLMWATGGSMVPDDIAAKDYKKGKELLGE